MCTYPKMRIDLKIVDFPTINGHGHTLRKHRGYRHDLRLWRSWPERNHGPQLLGRPCNFGRLPALLFMQHVLSFPNSPNFCFLEVPRNIYAICRVCLVFLCQSGTLTSQMPPRPPFSRSQYTTSAQMFGVLQVAIRKML